MLLWAASRHDSIEHTAQVLTGVPSGNGIRYHLEKFDDMAKLEQQVNAALQSHLPPTIVNRRHRLAIDLHLLPYYGSPSESEMPYIYRCQAKAGTTSFFAYATVYVIRAHQRVTLAIHAIARGETLVATLTYLLDKLTPLQVKVKRLYLDRGFYCVPVIRWLQALKLPFILPAVIRTIVSALALQTSYRIKNACCLRISTLVPGAASVVCRACFHPGQPLDLPALAVSQRQAQRGRRVYRERFRLNKTMLQFLGHAIERHFPVIHEIYLPTAP